MLLSEWVFMLHTFGYQVFAELSRLFVHFKTNSHRLGILSTSNLKWWNRNDDSDVLVNVFIDKKWMFSWMFWNHSPLMFHARLFQNYHVAWKVNRRTWMKLFILHIVVCCRNTNYKFFIIFLNLHVLWLWSLINTNIYFLAK